MISSQTIKNASRKRECRISNRGIHGPIRKYHHQECTLPILCSVKRQYSVAQLSPALGYHRPFLFSKQNLHVHVGNHVSWCIHIVRYMKAREATAYRIIIRCDHAIKCTTASCATLLTPSCFWTIGHILADNPNVIDHHSPDLT